MELEQRLANVQALRPEPPGSNAPWQDVARYMAACLAGELGTKNTAFLSNIAANFPKLNYAQWKWFSDLCARCDLPTREWPGFEAEPVAQVPAQPEPKKAEKPQPNPNRAKLELTRAEVLALSKRTGLDRSTIRQRIRRGWTMAEIETMPYGAQRPSQEASH